MKTMKFPKKKNTVIRKYEKFTNGLNTAWAILQQATRRNLQRNNNDNSNKIIEQLQLAEI